MKVSLSLIPDRYKLRSPSFLAPAFIVSEPPRGPGVSRYSDSGSGPALTGEVALVACTVDAWPAPHLAIYRDKVTW